jgi:hypothetical protein
VFQQEELTAKGIVGYERLARETPGVVLNRPTQNFNNFTACGISTNGYSAGLQAPVAICIDELPISANGNSTILDPNLYDVQRVEFLRGPQGTLLGSGSLAGAMRIITNAPNPLYLKRANDFIAASILHIKGVDTEQSERLYLLADEFIHPIELLLKSRIGLKIPRHRSLSALAQSTTLLRKTYRIF